jgi:hypothetical protein
VHSVHIWVKVAKSGKYGSQYQQKEIEDRADQKV